MEVDAGLLFSASMCSRLTFIDILAEAGAQQTVSLRTNAGKAPRFIHTLMLAQVAGVAAFINIIAGVAVLIQFIALITATEKGAIGVVAALLAWCAH